MPRIPHEVIQRLKRQVSIVRLCERYGIELKPQGKNMMGFCPWHKDDKPSFIVTPDKNLWHCMGACDEGGDVFSLVMKAESVSFRRAAEILLEISGSIPAAATVQTRSGTEHPILVKPEDDLSEPELLNHVTGFYHRAFLNDPKAMQYLEKRCCLHPEAVKRFKIGYANRTLGYRIPNTTADGKRLKQRLKALGIFRKSGHEHLSGSVVFPISDIEGRPVQMYGRKITAKLRKGTPDHLYLEGPLRGIWNAEGILHQRSWILCEAIIDALTLWCHGVRNVTCCFGKNTFTDDLWALMRKACPERVVIAFDNDAAGNKAAEKLAPKLAGQGVNVQRVKVPRGKDINEYVSALVQKDPKAAAHAIEGLLADAPIICRAEQGVEEEGARHASYALKLLQSEGQLTIASTGKDAATGQMVTKEYKVEGPVMIFTTTTAIDIDEELLNRCIILSVDESREQTQAIHKAQRQAETLEGLVKKLEKKDVLRVQKNAQRLLRPVEVINPYAGQLTFLDDQTRTRRDHKKYLTLIRAIAFLHQYQRPVKVLKHGDIPVKYVEATIDDIGVANELAHEVLGRCLDELPPQSRRFLDLVYEMVQTEQVINQPDINETLGIRDRAILEVLYSTGMRRMEVIGLKLYDIDADRGTIIIRQGKGKKDRMVPVGERALAWIAKYLEDARPELVIDPDDGTLFLTTYAEPFTKNRLTQLVRNYVDAADIGKKGSCHLFRHTVA